jgi:hypothetical protein
MTTRIGVPSILKTAKELCRLIDKFTPIIGRITGFDPAVMAALAAANAACMVLNEVLDELIVEGV